MNKTVNQRKTGIIRILMVLTVCFIWIHSFIPADLSGNESMRWVVWLNHVFSFLHLPFYFSGDHIVRKLAHFSEYALLGVESTLFFYWSGRLKERCGLHHLMYLGLTVAFLDETIQLFTPGRSGEIQDVWLDFLGFFIAALIVLLCRKKNTV